MTKKSFIWPTIVLLISCVLSLFFGSEYGDKADWSAYMWYLLPAGILAGLANYFIVYLGLPTAVPIGDERERKGGSAANDKGIIGSIKSLFENDQDGTSIHVGAWGRTRSEDIAYVGYIVTGLCGSLLTPVIHAIVNLKGLPDFTSIAPFGKSVPFIAFGYGLVFGFTANKLLNSVSDIVQAQLLARQTAILAGAGVNTRTSRPYIISQYLERLPNEIYENGNLILVAKVVSACTKSKIEATSINQYLENMNSSNSGWKKFENTYIFRELENDRLVLAGYKGTEQIDGSLAIVNMDKWKQLLFDWGKSENFGYGRERSLDKLFGKTLTSIDFYSHEI